MLRFNVVGCLLLLALMINAALCSSSVNGTFYQQTCEVENEGCEFTTKYCRTQEYIIGACLRSLDGKPVISVLACYPQKFHHIQAHIVVRTFSEANCTGLYQDENQVVGECFTASNGQHVINECAHLGPDGLSVSTSVLQRTAALRDVSDNSFFAK